MTAPNAATTLDNVVLYHRPTCGFCRRVYHALDNMNLKISGVNVSQDYDARLKLSKEGGKSQVPALHITHSNGRGEWLYESLDIIDYLQQQLS